MLDKEKLKAKREKEIAESLNMWQDLLGSENKTDNPKKEDKKK